MILKLIVHYVLKIRMEEMFGEINQLKSQLALAQAHKEAFEVNANRNTSIAMEQAHSLVVQKDQRIKELVIILPLKLRHYFSKSL